MMDVEQAQYDTDKSYLADDTQVVDDMEVTVPEDIFSSGNDGVHQDDQIDDDTASTPDQTQQVQEEELEQEEQEQREEEEEEEDVDLTEGYADNSISDLEDTTDTVNDSLPLEEQESATTITDVTSNEIEVEDNEEDGTLVDETWDMEGNDADDDQDNSSVDASLEAGDNVDEDGETIWNNDDDSDAVAEDDEEEETIEQGTVEVSENDRLGNTLEQALGALEEDEEQQQQRQQQQEASLSSDSKANIDDKPSSDDEDGILILEDVFPLKAGNSTISSTLHPPGLYNAETTTTIGESAKDDVATIDGSLWLLVAVCILLCFRLPYIKRFVVKLCKGKDNSNSSSSLPYHRTYSKELD